MVANASQPLPSSTKQWRHMGIEMAHASQRVVGQSCSISSAKSNIKRKNGTFVLPFDGLRFDLQTPVGLFLYFVEILH
jgi:hypothetical protein